MRCSRVEKHSFNIEPRSTVQSCPVPACMHAKQVAGCCSAAVRALPFYLQSVCMYVHTYKHTYTYSTSFILARQGRAGQGRPGSGSHTRCSLHRCALFPSQPRSRLENRLLARSLAPPRSPRALLSSVGALAQRPLRGTGSSSGIYLICAHGVQRWTACCGDVFVGSLCVMAQQRDR